jgi:hypothetical protein
MKLGRATIYVIAASVLFASLWGCAKKEDRSKEPSDTNSASSSQPSTEDRPIVASEETASQASIPAAPAITEKGPFSGPWACTLVLGSLGAAPAARILLLTDPRDRANADAYPLYEKAIEGLGSDFPSQVPDWIMSEGSRFPTEEAIHTLDAFVAPLAQLELGSKCRQCTWPKVKVGATVPHLTELRHLIFLVGLKARVHIEQRQFAVAATSLQTGMALTHHLGQASLVTQGQVAMAMESVLARQMRRWVQTSDAPTLYEAIAALPSSLVDIDRQFQNEYDNMSFLQRRMYKRTRKQILDPAQALSMFIQKRTNREMAALQTVEALRLYASTHQGQFPQTLAELTRAVPHDPTTDKPFVYRLEQGTAIIESTPKEASPKERLQYILKWQAAETAKGAPL